MKRPIDAKRWSDIRAIFDELVELDGAQRSERLLTIGASDPDLRRQVEALLAADAEASDDLARVEQAFASSPGDNAPELDRDPLGLAGRTISHFRIEEAIAAGGMRVVYRAEDTQLHRAIALKFPLPFQFQSDTRARFLNEARSAAALDHPNICSIHEVGETAGGLLFLAMPLYQGETLNTRLARAGPLDIAVAISIARQIALGLGAAHRAGIAHRDLKPANVMLLPDGTVKLLDFGLAKVRDLSLTKSGVVVGTVSYMSPEQVQGQPTDERADLWAIGVILYEMMTGSRPFQGEHDISVAHAIVHSEPRRAALLRPGISADMDQLIAALLHKQPTARLASADQLVAELDAISGSSVSPPPSRAPAVQERMMRRTPVAAMSIGAVALLLVLGSITLLVNRSSTHSDRRLREPSDPLILRDIHVVVARPVYRENRNIGRKAPVAARGRISLPLSTPPSDRSSARALVARRTPSVPRPA